MKPYLEESEVREVLGDISGVRGYCRCRKLRLPLYSVDRMTRYLKECIKFSADRGGIFPPDNGVIQTYRCKRCKKVILITLASLGIVE